MTYNLFDADNNTGTLVREKPRAATQTEARCYAMWLRQRWGLPMFDNVELHTQSMGGGGRSSWFIYRAATFGECYQPSRYVNGKLTVPEYETGAYSILIPGHDQTRPVVTLETLDDAGEVVSSQTLPVEPKKGGVIWDAAAVRKACGPVAKNGKAKRKAPISDAAPEPVEAPEAAAAPDIEPIAPEVAPDAVALPDLDAITARLDALERKVATLAVKPAPTARPARTAAHERAVRRAWAERRAARLQRAAADDYRRMREGTLRALQAAENSTIYLRNDLSAVTQERDILASERDSLQSALAVAQQSEAEAMRNAEAFARRGTRHLERRRASAQRARRMIAEVRARGYLDRTALQAANAHANVIRAELDKLKRDLADPSQPERASDVARLLAERDQARNALAAVTARAERQKAALDQMTEQFDGMLSRMCRAEAALRAAGVIAA